MIRDSGVVVVKRSLVAALSAVVLSLGLSVAGAPAASAAAYCGQVWGSGPKGAGDSPARNTVTAIRTGRHACYDRLVLQFSQPVTSWAVEYDDEPLFTEPGPSLVVGVATAVGPIPASAEWRQVADVRRYRTFRGVHSTSPWTTLLQLDVRARLPFRAFVLAGPGGGSRLVVDVAHRWCTVGSTSC